MDARATFHSTQTRPRDTERETRARRATWPRAPMGRYTAVMRHVYNVKGSHAGHAHIYTSDNCHPHQLGHTVAQAQGAHATRFSLSASPGTRGAHNDAGTGAYVRDERTPHITRQHETVVSRPEPLALPRRSLSPLHHRPTLSRSRPRPRPTLAAAPQRTVCLCNAPNHPPARAAATRRRKASRTTAASRPRSPSKCSFDGA